MSPEVRATTPSADPDASARSSFIRAANRATPGNPASESGKSFDSPSLLCKMTRVKAPSSPSPPTSPPSAPTSPPSLPPPSVSLAMVCGSCAPAAEGIAATAPANNTSAARPVTRPAKGPRRVDASALAPAQPPTGAHMPRGPRRGDVPVLDHVAAGTRMPKGLRRGDDMLPLFKTAPIARPGSLQPSYVKVGSGFHAKLLRQPRPPRPIIPAVPGGSLTP